MEKNNSVYFLYIQLKKLRHSIIHSRNTSMTKMVSGKDIGQKQKCLPACQENNFYPTVELSAAYPPPATSMMDFSTWYYNNPDFCVLLVKLVDYCKDPYIKETLDSTYVSMSTSSGMCSRLNKVYKNM